MNKKALYLLISSLIMGVVVALAAICILLPHPRLDALLCATTLRQPHTSFDWKAHVSDWAGTGQAGWHDGRPTDMQFSDPYGIAVDRHGNVYVADAGDNNRIRKIRSDGNSELVAGSTEGFADGTASLARFHTPSGLVVDANDNVYVADTGNHVIRKISAAGVVTTLAGTGQPGYLDGQASQAQFNGPTGIALDQRGNLLVADTYNDRIRVISPTGMVSTLAGSGQPGFQDGAAAEARFDTPCGIAVNSRGEVIVADTRNNALRVIDRNGSVTTLFRPPPNDHDATFLRPLSLAVTQDDFIYVGSMNDGAIFQFAANGAMRLVTDPVDPAVPAAIQIPYGLGMTKDGALLVADSPTFKLKMITPRTAPDLRNEIAPAPMLTRPNELHVAWPFKPQHVAHEIVGTMGEDRGNDHGESRDHFHAGIDVRANMGTEVLAVMPGKVNDPLGAWGYGNLGEGIRVGTMHYIHMRVGRNEKNELLDPVRFVQVVNDQNKPVIRVRRGTRFAKGDVLGTVNRMFHLHLEYHPYGVPVNPLLLGFEGQADHIAPHIDHIALMDHEGKPLTQKRRGRLLVGRDAGPLSIVVDAYDQMDGNESRRRLGLYQLGYQILDRHGQPFPGFEQPRMNIEFNILPTDDGVKAAFWEGSGETVHGNRVTQFLYVVTNRVRDGVVGTGVWQPAELAVGDYVLRVFAGDFFGNWATAGNNLAITVL